MTLATHCGCNILDLVITPGTKAILTDVSVDLITDYKVIMCK